MSRRVVVVGAGITGLTVAYRISHAPVAAEVLVVDTDREPGGVIRSVQVGDLELEAGPDSFLVGKPWAMDLCYELELERELVPQGAVASQILTRRGLLPVPPGRLGIPASAIGLLRWKGMSVAARLRAMAEPAVPRRRSGADRSVGQLLRRRLGRGATNALVAPLLSGISAADIDLLSVDAAFPELARWDRELGSLRAGARASATPVRRVPAGPTTPFATIRGGLRRLPDALAEALGAERLRLGSAVVKLGREERGPFRVVTTSGDDLPADSVVLATPAARRRTSWADWRPRHPSSSEGSMPHRPRSRSWCTRRGRTASSRRRRGSWRPGGCCRSPRRPRSRRSGLGTRSVPAAVMRAFVGGAGLEDELDRPDEEDPLVR